MESILLCFAAQKYEHTLRNCVRHQESQKTCVRIVVVRHHNNNIWCPSLSLRTSNFSDFPLVKANDLVGLLKQSSALHFSPLSINWIIRKETDWTKMISYHFGRWPPHLPNPTLSYWFLDPELSSQPVNVLLSGAQLVIVSILTMHTNG